MCLGSAQALKYGSNWFFIRHRLFRPVAASLSTPLNANLESFYAYVASVCLKFLTPASPASLINKYLPGPATHWHWKQLSTDVTPRHGWIGGMQFLPPSVFTAPPAGECVHHPISIRLSCLSFYLLYVVYLLSSSYVVFHVLSLVLISCIIYSTNYVRCYDLLLSVESVFGRYLSVCLLDTRAPSRALSYVVRSTIHHQQPDMQQYHRPARANNAIPYGWDICSHWRDGAGSGGSRCIGRGINLGLTSVTQVTIWLSIFIVVFPYNGNGKTHQ